MRRLASIEDWRAAARRNLPNLLFEYIDGGSYAETTLRWNNDHFAQLPLRQRVMRDMSRVNTRTNLLGQSFSMPIMLGPVGFSGMYARRGEVQAARAARTAGVPFALSTVGICSVDEVTTNSGVAPWFQLYLIKDRGAMRALIARAVEAGCPVLILTVDLPTPGARYRDVRSGMSGRPDGGARMRQIIDGLLRPGWMLDVYARGRPHEFGNLSSIIPKMASFAEAWDWIGANFDQSVVWRDLDFIRETWSGPIVVKGVLDVDDARDAIRFGADAIVVSNHGGRQLDGAQSTVRAMPAIADAVGDALPLLLDGGVRSGLDVLKGLALGAKAVLLGRAWAYALAGGGEAGVRKMLATMRSELSSAMVLTGCADVADASADLLA